VILSVHKQRNKSYIFSVVFVINQNWKNYCFCNCQNGVSSAHVQWTCGKP